MNSGDTWTQSNNGNYKTFQSPYKTSSNGGFSFEYLGKNISGPPYPIVAYVYGGDDNVDTFISRISSGVCPGGKGTSSYVKKIYSWDSQDNCYEYSHKYYYAKEYLAGIDCSAYASYCWEVSRRSTGQLADISKINNGSIEKNKLKKGDILNYPGVHVRIFDKWDDPADIETSKVWIYEAQSISDLDSPGVVYRVEDWSSKYPAYTIFPIISDESPKDTYTTNMKPEIACKVACPDSGSLSITSFKIINLTGSTNIDVPISDSIFDAATSTTTCKVIKYTPSETLTYGIYNVEIKSKNTEFSKEYTEDFTWEFKVSKMKLDYSLDPDETEFAVGDTVTVMLDLSQLISSDTEVLSAKWKINSYPAWITLDKSESDTVLEITKDGEKDSFVFTVNNNFFADEGEIEVLLHSVSDTGAFQNCHDRIKIPVTLGPSAYELTSVRDSETIGFVIVVKNESDTAMKDLKWKVTACDSDLIDTGVFGTEIYFSEIPKGETKTQTIPYKIVDPNTKGPLSGRFTIRVSTPSAPGCNVIYKEKENKIRFNTAKLAPWIEVTNTIHIRRDKDTCEIIGPGKIVYETKSNYYFKGSPSDSELKSWSPTPDGYGGSEYTRKLEKVNIRKKGDYELIETNVLENTVMKTVKINDNNPCMADPRNISGFSNPDPTFIQRFIKIDITDDSRQKNVLVDYPIVWLSPETSKPYTVEEIEGDYKTRHMEYYDRIVPESIDRADIYDHDYNLAAPLNHSYVFSPYTSRSVYDDVVFMLDFPEYGHYDLKIFSRNGDVLHTIAEGKTAHPGLIKEYWDGETNRFEPDVFEDEFTYVLDYENDAGYRICKEGTILIDEIIPVIRIDEIKPISSEPGIYGIYGRVYDKNLDSYNIYINGTLIANSDYNSGGLLGKINGRAYTPGEYKLEITAYDLGGNYSHKEKTVVLNGGSFAQYGNTAGVKWEEETRFRSVDGLPSIYGYNTNISSIEQSITEENIPIPDIPGYIVEDDFPASSTLTGSFSWITDPVYSGGTSHTNNSDSAWYSHYYLAPSEGVLIEQDGYGVEKYIVQYLYIEKMVDDRGLMLDEIIMQFYTDNGNGEHRCYFGADLIPTGGVNNTPSLMRLGGIFTEIPVNQWVRLKIPTSAVGLVNKKVKGILFGHHGGDVVWDKTCLSTEINDSLPDIYPIPESDVPDNNTTFTFTYFKNNPLTDLVAEIELDGTVIRSLSVDLCDTYISTILWDGKDDADAYVDNGFYTLNLKDASDSTLYDSKVVFVNNLDAEITVPAENSLIRA
ncbi:hypothetical protein KAU32_01145, partial [bacterium]|nr:hypothetical protein [bacterium]